MLRCGITPIETTNTEKSFNMIDIRIQGPKCEAEAYFAIRCIYVFIEDYPDRVGKENGIEYSHNNVYVYVYRTDSSMVAAIK